MRARTLALLLAAAPLAAQPPPAPAEALRIGADGRGFVDAAGRPVFVLADTAWALVTRLRREEITAYLTHRRAQGFNAIAAVLYAPANSDINDSPLNAYGAAPFPVAAGRPDPAQPLVTPGADPARAGEYDYWDHVDFALGELRRLGFFGFILPCWGNEIAATPGTRPLADPAVARAYGRWLGARYATATHVAWMLGGDRSAVDTKTGEDFRPQLRAMAAGLIAAAPGALLSYHPQKIGPQSGDWFHGDAWLAFNSVQLWPEAQLAAIARDWNARPVKPTWLFEGRYEGYWKRGYKPEDWGEWQVRQQAWQTVFAGACGHTYGHERVFGFGVSGVDWRPSMDSPGARSMTHLAAFMRTLPPAVALGRGPDQTLLAGPEGQAERLRSDRITVTRAADGTWAAAYAADGRPVRLRLDRLAPGPLRATWFDPRTGRSHDAGGGGLAGGPGAGEREFTPPAARGDGGDWVLVLARAESPQNRR
jgi:hypothetical protein